MQYFPISFVFSMVSDSTPSFGHSLTGPLSQQNERLSISGTHKRASSGTNPSLSEKEPVLWARKLSSASAPTVMPSSRLCTGLNCSQRQPPAFMFHSEGHDKIEHLLVRHKSSGVLSSILFLQDAFSAKLYMHLSHSTEGLHRGSSLLPYPAQSPNPALQSQPQSTFSAFFSVLLSLFVRKRSLYGYFLTYHL